MFHNIEEWFSSRCNIRTDINEHLPILRSYGSRHNHITEMGVRDMNSTSAWVASKPKTLICYDRHVPKKLSFLEQICNENSIQFRFIQANVLKIEIESTDLLFIDTLHRYAQLSQELKLHAKKVKSHIILHDTTAFGHIGEGELDDKGLCPAVEEFLDTNQDWSILQKLSNNNGLTILEKK